MQENEFEKQVQQKMEELRMDPSEATWQKVAVQVAKEKKKRRWFLLLPLAAILLAGSFYWMKYGERKQDTSFTENKEKQTRQALGDVDKIKTGQNDKEEQPIASIEDNSKEGAGLSAQKNKSSLPLTKNTNAIRNVPLKKISTKAKTKVLIAAPAIVSEDNDKQQREIEDITEPVSPENQEEVAGKVNEGTIKNIDTTATTAEKTLVKKDTGKVAQPLVAIQNKEKNAWTYAIAFTPGISVIKNGYLGLINSNDPLADANYGTGSSVSNYQPSRLRAGFAFNINFMASKKITPRSALTIGINYKLITAAMYTDGRFGNNPNNVKYHNKFHFIELPFGIQSSIGKSKSSPVFWHTEISLSQLVYTNALQFNASSGRYYKDNNFFNKTGLSLAGGLLFNLGRKNPGSLLIGPDFYYSLTKVADKDFYDKRHYSFIGIRVQKSLRLKKIKQLKL